MEAIWHCLLAAVLPPISGSAAIQTATTVCAVARFSTQDAAAFKGQTLELLQSLTLSLHKEVTLRCSLFLLIFLSALFPFNRLGYQSPPLFRAFTPCAQTCLFSATALLTFEGSEVSLVKLTNLVIRSCCLGAAQ